MESIYLGIVLFLFLLAIFDLVVGVSNDAVNFLGSAVGARAASFKWIMGVAAVGILCGAVMSNGMMDVARHGIFRPEQFYFQDIMCICLAVMAIDVILLDTFNTLGLPTSTTVSIVFELLGGAFALAMVKLAADDTGLTFADMLNSEKALSVIMAIFLSVAIAFVFGAVVQYIARLIFTFNYKSHMKWSAALFGGVAMTAIIYFILIKGMKDSSFMTPELSEWISTYTRHLVAGCFIFFCLQRDGQTAHQTCSLAHFPYRKGTGRSGSEVGSSDFREVGRPVWKLNFFFRAERRKRPNPASFQSRLRGECCICQRFGSIPKGT